ncbi:MAG: hypothetical protein QOG20_6204 [Pseudonocardiales bacterium]|nr:hypothetical protein [Pseudonocardiales bacterium]
MIDTEPTGGTRPETPLRRRTQGRLSIAVVAVALALGLASWVSPAVRHQLGLSFTAEPSRYTELYFLAGRPPVFVRELGGVAQVGVDFVVAHDGTSASSYTYRVEVRGPGERPLNDQVGTVTVEAGMPRAVHVVLDLPGSDKWESVGVSLVGRTESIHYTAPDTGAGPS